MRSLEEKHKQNKEGTWGIVLVILIVYVLNQGTPLYAGTQINTAMVLQEGLDPSFVGNASSLNAAVRMFSSMFAGYVATRFGVRAMVLIGSTVGIICSLAMALLPLPVCLRAVVYGLMGMMMVYGAVLSSQMLINAYFTKNRSVPMAVTLAGGSVSGMLFSKLGESVSSYLGWRHAWLVGTFSGLVSFALCFLFLFPNDREDTFEKSNSKASERDSLDIKTANKQLLTSRVFLILAGTWAARNLLYMVILSYLNLYCVSLGYTTANGATAVFVMSAAGLAGRLLVAPLDRSGLPICYPWIVTSLLMFIGGCLLGVGNAFPVICTGAGLIGFGYGTGFVLNPLIIGTYFQPKKNKIAIGLFSTFAAISGMIGPAAAAALGGSIGYPVLFVLAGTPCLIFSFLNMNIKNAAVE